jgi:hypothetical protein
MFSVAKSSIFGTILSTQNVEEANFYLNNSYVCWLDRHLLLNKDLWDTEHGERYVTWIFIFFIITEFCIKPSRVPTSEPPRPDLGCDLRLHTTGVGGIVTSFITYCTKAKRLFARERHIWFSTLHSSSYWQVSRVLGHIKTQSDSMWPHFA